MDRVEGLNPELIFGREKGRHFFWLTCFSIAMGFMEGAIVIYLRKIYYPDGFRFPLSTIDSSIGLVEFLREAATVIMLVAIGIIAGKNGRERFLYFMYCFGIWDITYYVVLKIFLGWPVSIFDWDILFLIPIPWVGPVLAPCIVSLSMICIAIIFIDSKRPLNNAAIALMIFGCIIIVYSFCIDYLNLIFIDGKQLWRPGSSDGLFREMKSFIPVQYNWKLFCVGEGLILFVVINALINKKKSLP